MCGTNVDGQAYCSLHPSDDLVIQYLEAVHSREVELIPRLQYEVQYFAQLQNSSSCFVEHVTELEKFEILKEREVRCMSYSQLLSFAVGVYGLFL